MPITLHLKRQPVVPLESEIPSPDDGGFEFRDPSPHYLPRHANSRWRNFEVYGERSETWSTAI
jgi:hypothetical protein